MQSAYFEVYSLVALMVLENASSVVATVRTDNGIDLPMRELHF